jgi:hypothetical protein
MDTTWFAIDDDGCVAAFDSGENGAVPKGDWEAIAPPKGRASETIRELRPPVSPPGQSIEPHIRAPRGYPIVVFVESLDALAGVDPTTYSVVRSQGNAAVVFASIDPEGYAALHRAGACLHCASTGDDEPSSRGFYWYRHLCDNWLPGPYGRIGSPTAPVHANDLPDRVTRSFARFRGSFAESPLLQPGEHWHVETWGELALQLGTDFRTLAPLPGKEADYDEALDTIGPEFAPAIGDGRLIVSRTAPAIPDPPPPAPPPTGWRRLKKLFGGD